MADAPTPLATGRAIWTWIPQRPPMILLDTIWWVDQRGARGGLTVRPDTPFVANGYLQAPGVIEHMAQTAAAHAGGRALKAGKDARTGFIAAIKHWQLEQLPPVGATIDTTIAIRVDLANYLIVEALTQLRGEPLARGAFNLYLPD